MDLFSRGQLNPAVFEENVCRVTRDWDTLRALLETTQSALIESTHFLIALADIPEGIIQKCIQRRSIALEDWKDGLASCVRKSETPLQVSAITESHLEQHVKQMLHAARAKALEARLARISEAILLLAAIEHVTEDVRELCDDAGIDLKLWHAELEDIITPPPDVEVFDEAGKLVLASFTPQANKVLRLLRTETEALGYEQADPRHLLMALLEAESGATQYGLYHQAVVPRKVQEAVVLNLRNRAKRTRSSISLERKCLTPTLQEILMLSGQFAGRDRMSVAEKHLLEAFLTVTSSALSLLEDQKVKLRELRRTTEEFDAAEEGDGEGETSVADAETVRQGLHARLVGQERAIEQIIPYIEFLRFGMRTPGHPVGVFLFCGQSGSGKTEMAKELARAVYGSEENLIFLEMGQFNAPESMNIFVGAPPGYIGYGEGKLTNGLRDKPQAVVLFDEVEKAHAKVLDALLRFLDEGRIDDPAGPVRDGADCIVILTSNVAADELDSLWEKYGDRPNARTEIRKELRDKFKKHDFRPEFLNRVDEVILFNTLKETDYIEIAKRTLEVFTAKLKEELLIDVDLDYNVADCIGRYCAYLNEGARAVTRVARAVLLLPVCRFVLQTKSTPPIALKARAHQMNDDPAAEPVGKVELR